jgi:thiamine phosphate synthase YjbQ (UPF0047 family)
MMITVHFRILFLLPQLLLVIVVLDGSLRAVDCLSTSPSSTTTATTSNNIKKTTTQATKFGPPVCIYHEVEIPSTEKGPPRQTVSVEDLTSIVNTLLEESNMQYGTTNVISRHTTTSITINEKESRLERDISDVFLKLIPPDERSTSTQSQKGIRYKHNDIDERPESIEEKQRCLDNGWNIHDETELQKWRDQEPINAHSHLLSILTGSSESVPVVDGKLVLGQWQSILLVDLDGPRARTVGIQFIGYEYPEKLIE